MIKNIIQTSADKKLKHLKTILTPRKKKLDAKKRKADAEADAKWNEEEIAAASAATEKIEEKSVAVIPIKPQNKQSRQHDNSKSPM